MTFRCTIVAEVFSCRDNRLVVNNPDIEYARGPRLAFKLAEDARVSLESDDFRRAKPGDKVTRLVAARFSTGDTLIKELTVEVAGIAAPQPQSASVDVSKYRHLSAAPSKPRDVRSQHFLIHTDVSDRDAQILVDTLETMIFLVSNYFGRPPAGILECYVVRDLDTFPVSGMDPIGIRAIRVVGGMTLMRTVTDGTRYLAKSIVYADARWEVVQHEVVHAYCHHTFGHNGPSMIDVPMNAKNVDLVMPAYFGSGKVNDSSAGLRHWPGHRRTAQPGKQGGHRHETQPGDASPPEGGDEHRQTLQRHGV